MSDAQGLVLVVDDNEMNRDMLARRLKRQNLEVEVAETGQRALEMLQLKTFDLVLLDIMMPGMSGYEVLDHIKHDPASKHIPVIMISAVDDLDSVVKCIEMGAEDYLFKPFNPVLLKARVGASLERKALLDRLQSSAGGVDGAVLRSIQGKLDALLSGAAGALNSEQQDALIEIRTQLEQLSLSAAGK